MKTLTLRKIRHKQGFEYAAQTFRPGLSSHKTPSSAIVLENGMPLPGPANVPHESIRNLGAGRYSLWFGMVRFSTPDNSDPRTNGRSYSLWYDESEEERFGWLTRILYIPIMLMYRSFLPVPLKKFLMESGYSVESCRHLGWSFPFWSLFYWFAFIYVILLPDNKQD